MSRPPRYAAVILDDGQELTITQYSDPAEAREEYRLATENGLTAYFYAFPIRRKSDIPNPAPIEIID